MSRPKPYLPGERLWFEYHCDEGCDSSDRMAFLHSHQKVTVIRQLSDDEADMDDIGFMYRVRFDDGLEWDVFDDEITRTRGYRGKWQRPDPPTRTQDPDFFMGWEPHQDPENHRLKCPLFRRSNPDFERLGYPVTEDLRAFWREFQDGTAEYKDWARGGDGRREDKHVWINIENDADRPFVWIENIGSNERGKGLASKALTWLCQLADRHGIELRLVPESLDRDEGMTTFRLRQWYGRHGFRPRPKTRIMARRPQ